MSKNEKNINILGIRGIPAAHGGFETFAAHFAPFLISKGWSVTVYCQEDLPNEGKREWTDFWHGIKRVHFAPRSHGALSTIEFDFRSTLHVLREPGIDLVLGYNTAIFLLIQRLFGRIVVMNMDGIEWKRAKWGKPAKIWFWLMEWMGGKLANVPIADHPAIAEHLAKRGIAGSRVIPYGADEVETSDGSGLISLGLVKNGFFVSIARIEPENSILEIVQAYSQAGTSAKLVVLGKFDPSKNDYHSAIASAASQNVIFPGAIYDAQTVRDLRLNCLAYVHGHQVGGTNPSLVEALGAGSPVLAHDNTFNRWTAGDNQMFFSSVAECSEAMIHLENDSEHRAILSRASRARHSDAFTFEIIENAYEDMLIDQLAINTKKSRVITDA